ncbi:myo-inosose-2 dehydratase [Bradyrhizobium sp. Arg237L]|uniref:myo-inosose-2 dehydratase n=1 Tax=Bradyrhizobium sp. Arg237L TaxID=3003352 RepID=UPI00249F8786|nr:myo-inosose-2 dehydratase [Bradyrhizobium sp. Arg237L]MDI4232499.1 myo-inosose-2 dehydratase [Bradyrhizobium sp. Arg237L]
MILGIQPTGWTNDDFPEIGDDTPYQEILDQTKEAGFEGGSTGHTYPTHLPSLRHALESRGLKIASTWAGTAFSTGLDVEAAFASFQAQVAFLKEVGAQNVVVAELANAVNQVRTKSVLNDRPKLNTAQWFLLTELLDRAGEYAKDQGMQLSYHPHVGTCVMTVKETERLLDHTNPDYVGLCLDTGHLCYGGACQKEIVELTRKYATRITHVHLKNVRRAVLPDAKDYSFYQAIKSGIFTVPGDLDGALDLDPIMEILKEAKYDRWIVIEAEQAPAKYDPCRPQIRTPLTYARIARAYLRKHLGY